MALGPLTAACVKCKTYLRNRKSGVLVLETFEDGRPYNIWTADLWECPDCQQQIVKGYGLAPLASHYEDKFEEYLKRIDITILGCPKPLRRILDETENG